MKTIKIMVSIFLAIVVLVVGFFSFFKGETSTIQPRSTLSQDDLMIKGEYLAKLGDCAACHTSDKGDFAGGVGLGSGTPVGFIYPSNITPDMETGIGSYSLQDFDNAMRYGLKKTGLSIYPAMPYPSFASVTSEDIEALYAYFMHKVTPVKNKVAKPTGSWPFTMNWPVNAWRILFAPPVSPLLAFTENSNELVRGAYIVEGLGHCGTCHTPRDVAMVEKALSDDSHRYFLSGGGTLEGWNAVNLRGDDMDGLGRMSKEELVLLLKTGRNSSAAVFGSMVVVVKDSLQHLTDQDIHAMASYLKSLSPKNPNGPKFHYDSSTHNALAKGDVQKAGALTYLNTCAGCHRSDGKGYEETFPSLAGNAAILNDNADTLISVILRGSHVPETQLAPTDYTMLGYSWRLDDQDATDLVNFVRTSWGNQAREVSVNEVTRLREQTITPAVLLYQQTVNNEGSTAN